MLARALAPVAFALVTACANSTTPVDASSTTGASSAGEDSGPTAANTGASTGPAPTFVEADNPPPADEHADLPDCPSEADKPPKPYYCTESGKLIGGWVFADQLRIPDSARVLFYAEGESNDASNLTVAASEDSETLYLRHVTCSRCARITGSAFGGMIDAMTPEQVLALQAELGLPKDTPALRTIAEWEAYAGSPAGVAALTKIAGWGRVVDDKRH